MPIVDANGKAIDGIQLTQFKHPLAFFLARNGGSPLYAISGHLRSYTDEELAVLYPRRSAFFPSVIQTTRYNLEQGYILWPEAKRTVAEAFRAVARSVRVPTVLTRPSSQRSGRGEAPRRGPSR